VGSGTSARDRAGEAVGSATSARIGKAYYADSSTPSPAGPADQGRDATRPGFRLSLGLAVGASLLFLLSWPASGSAAPRSCCSGRRAQPGRGRHRLRLPDQGGDLLDAALSDVGWFAGDLLIVGRQLLTLLDNQALNRRLGAMVGELEHRAFHDGLAVSEATEVDAVLREADVAMYTAKARREGRFELVSSSV
jgi:hypothetical protein